MLPTNIIIHNNNKEPHECVLVTSSKQKFFLDTRMLVPFIPIPRVPKKDLQNHFKKATNSTIIICVLAESCGQGTISKYQNTMPNVASKAFSIRRSGTQYVAKVTKLGNPYCGVHAVESYCKASSISNTNWLRCLLSSQLIKIWLSL